MVGTNAPMRCHLPLLGMPRHSLCRCCLAVTGSTCDDLVAQVAALRQKRLRRQMVDAELSRREAECQHRRSLVEALLLKGKKAMKEIIRSKKEGGQDGEVY